MKSLRQEKFYGISAVRTWAIKWVDEQHSLEVSKDAKVTDILNAFKKLDEGSIDFLPFVPLKLDRILCYDSEETNIFSLITRVAVIEQTLSFGTNDIAVAKNEIQALKSH